MPELPPKAFSKLSRTIGTGSPGPLGKVRDPLTGLKTGAGGRPRPTAGPGYAELQVASNFSFLRGASHPDELVLTAAALGHEAIAITDRNSVAGIVRAHSAAKTVGIRLVIGVRLELRDGTSLLAFPEDRAAYARLTRLLTLGKRRAPKGECHLDYADVVAHGEGQVVIVLPSADDGATAAFAARVAADFAGRAYLAAQHLYRGDDARRLARLAAIADAIGLPLVATGDVLYHVPERRPLQDVVTCIREHCTIAAAGFRLLPNAERHLKPPAEMARLFRGYEDALARTLEIVERCRFSLDELCYEYPDEPVPAGKTPQQHIADLVWAGAQERLADYPSPPFRGEREGPIAAQWEGEVGARDKTGECSGIPRLTPTLSTPGGGEGDLRGIPENLRAQIEHELALIEQLDFARYFLTVHDIVAYARSQDILCQGRGSAANSLVCYCLGITSVGPDRIDALFERFISAARGEPPDIDVDFEHERREEVIQYIYERYGRDHAGIAATVICYRARGAIREVGKVLGLSGDVVAALAGIVWGWSSERLADQRVREAGLDPTDRTLRLALDLAGELIGFPRHLSQHVGGFVITRGPLSELVPIENAAMEDRTVIEWDKDDLDALHILKIDILALGMLTCVRKAFALIAQHYRQNWALHTIPEERPEVYDMLSRGDSVGVFQVESRAQMSMLPRLKPREFYDLVIEVAIVRPGPIQGDMVHPYLRRRSGKEPVEYPSPELRQVLKKTLGVPLFQEQAMKIAIVGAGFTPEEADRLRRAMATFKRNGDIHKFREQFVAGMLANNYRADFATRCFDQIEGFGTYGFPESHAASFALLVYVSAWIKCFYPDVFACALLNSQPMGFYAPAQIVRDAREHGVEVRPADVNFSDWDNTLEPLDTHLILQDGNAGCASFETPASPAPQDEETVLDGIKNAPHPESLTENELRNSSELDFSSFPRKREPRGRGCGLWSSDDAQPTEPFERSPWAPAFAGATVRDCFQTFHSESDSEERSESASRRTHHASPPRRALRLGLRQVKGFSEADAKRLVAARGAAGFRDASDLWRKSGLGRAALERLAAADALRSLADSRGSLDRRRGLWALQALGEPPLPLFAHIDRHPGEGRDPSGRVPVVSEVNPGLRRGDEKETFAASLLPEMPLGEHVVEDYATVGLTIKRHPLAFLRAELKQEGLVRAVDLQTLPVDRSFAIAGLVLIRQRPGSANGVIFVTLEDESGVANLIVWPAVLERFRRAVLGATLLYCRGKLQREQSVIHLVADDLQDWTARLNTLRDRTGDEPPPPLGPRTGPPFVNARDRPPGYDSRDIVIPSRDFR